MDFRGRPLRSLLPSEHTAFKLTALCLFIPILEYAEQPYRHLCDDYRGNYKSLNVPQNLRFSILLQEKRHIILGPVTAVGILNGYRLEDRNRSSSLV
jgi:hypothetical protein